MILRLCGSKKEVKDAERQSTQIYYDECHGLGYSRKKQQDEQMKTK